MVLHPFDHPLGLLQRRRNQLKPADRGDGRSEGVDKVSPGLEERAAAAVSASSVFSPPVSSPLRQLVLRLERRQERPVLPALAVLRRPGGLLEQLPHPGGVEGPEQARVVQPPPLRQSLRVAAKLQVSKGVVCFYFFIYLLFKCIIFAVFMYLNAFVVGAANEAFHRGARGKIERLERKVYGSRRFLREKEEEESEKKRKRKRNALRRTVFPQLEVAYPPEHGAPHPLRPLHQRPRAPARNVARQVLLPSHEGRPDAPGAEEDGPAAAEPADQLDFGRGGRLPVDQLLRLAVFFPRFCSFLSFEEEVKANADLVREGDARRRRRGRQRERERKRV